MAKEDTNFKDMTVPELKVVAEKFAVDLDGVTKKDDIINEIANDGVTFQMYKKLVKEEEAAAAALAGDEPVELQGFHEEPGDMLGRTAADPVPVSVGEDPDDEPVVHVVKMTRKNHTFQIRGYNFSRQNPFALVSEEDADFLVETGGFRMASPKELKEFYGQG